MTTKSEWTVTIETYQDYEDHCWSVGTTPIPFGYGWKSHWARLKEEQMTVGRIEQLVTNNVVIVREDKTTPTPNDFISAFRHFQQGVYQNAKDKGWWDEDRNDGEMIALMHSELSEALEALRHGNPPSDHIPEFTGEEEELADTIIRIMDRAAARNLRVAEAIIAKHEFNKTRPVKHGGKKF